MKVNINSATDLTNYTFGMLTVLERDYEKELTVATRRPYWKCQCECGNIVSVRASHLIAGESLSCGCLRRKQHLVDITGNKYGKLTVLGYNAEYTQEKRKTTKDRGSYWNCQCECGNICIRSRESLLSPNYSTCHECSIKDLTGVKRNMLTALYRIGSNSKGESIWHCRCDCGNEVDYNTNQFCTRVSCGCKGKSRGELCIENILKENQIKYIFDDTYFTDLILPSNYLARYDFILLNNGIPYRIIEFDGEQHFKENTHWKQTLEEIQQSDKIKNDYAFKHNIPIVRIPYTKINDINLQTLLGDEYLLHNNEEYEKYILSQL